jgi:hypothetical protein
MKLVKIANNCHELQMHDKKILFSYATPVAIEYNEIDRVIVTTEKFSKTTSKHINLWADTKPGSESLSVPQSVIEMELEDK